MEPLSGSIIKGYELRERIGAGGFGAVYRAYQSTVGREVAIKIILPGYANQPEFVRRFETEAQLVARLEHMNITPLYDYWRDPEGAYLVMRYLRGGSLNNALQQGPYDLEATVLLLDQVASALAVAHRNQVIHRDIKPANILLDEDGNAYVSDFGLAKDLVSTGDPLSLDGAVLGTPDYLSPEQVRSEPVTPQSDIYSLGIVLYEMLTGCHPFPEQTPVERLFKHLNDPVPEITALDPGVSAAINAVVQKATAKNPHQRYKEVMALATAFREAAGLSGSQADKNLVELLTPREQEVLKLIIAGKSNREIADKLVVELTTVKWYITQLYRKLNVRSRVQAIVRARELNLIVNGRISESAISSISALPAAANPYKGLRAFQAADEQDFFGREKLTRKLLAMMRQNGDYGRFLAVVGPSGSGKSSLVKAGLIPALWRGELPGSERWFITDLIPGAHPLDELEVALIHVAANRPENLREQLERNERGLIRAAQIILPDDGSELVLVIDQFEEVFTLVEDEAARVHFLELLQTAVADPRSRVRVVITLRADFYDRPLQYSDFGEMVRSRMETVLPLTAAELEQTITGPAQRVGVRFEEGLVAAIVSEVNYQPGALPLLQYALTELFEARENRTLTHEGYRQIGRATGALARRAEQIYTELDEPGQEAARQMFLRLVTLGEGVEDTRRRVARAELLAIAANPDLMDEVIDTYAIYRLLALDHEPGSRTPTVEVAHEAILREWERLRGWLNDSRADIRMQRQLARVAQEWREAGGEASFLLRGSRLDNFEKWAAGTALAMTALERDYLAASLAEQERRAAAEQARQARETALERRSQNVLRILVAVFAVATIIAIGLTMYAFSQRNEAQANFTRAERIRLAAQAQIALDRGEDVVIPALLALRSLQHGYSPEADSALLSALSRGFARQCYVGHTDAVASAALSPDGRYVLTAANDATARLWDTQTGAEIHRFIGHTEFVSRAIFSPDGKYVLTGSADHTVRLWEAGTGREVGRLPDHSSTIWALAFSPDGNYILSSDESGLAWLWDAQTMEQLLQLSGHGDTVLWGVFSPDGQMVFTGSIDRTARVWDINTGQELRRFEGHAGAISGGQFSPDGRLLLTASYDNTARLWDIATGQEMRRFSGHTNLLLAAAFSPNGRTIVTGSQDRTARLWDVQTGQEVHQFLGHTAPIISVAFSPDGQYVLIGSADAARLWDVQFESEPGILAPPFRTVHGATVVLAKFAADSQRVFIGNADGTIRLWNMQTRQIIHESKFETGGLITDLAFSPDEKFILTASGDGAVRLWAAQTGQELVQFNGHTGSVWNIDFSPDGRTILTGSDDGTARLWDVQTGAEVHRLTGHAGPVRGVAFSPDGRTALTSSDDATARLWNTQTGDEVYRLTDHTGPVRDVAFSPDGHTVLTGSADQTTWLWDAQTGQKVRRFVGHTDQVWAVAFSPDGRYVLTGSDDLTIRLWDAGTGQVMRQFVGHQEPVRFLAFSPDGRRVLSGDFNIAYLWRVELTEMINTICAQLPRDFSADERILYDITDSESTCEEGR